jgi:hypothetical protein
MDCKECGRKRSWPNVTYYLPQNFQERAEENYVKPHSGYAVSGLRFELGISII